MMNICGQCGGAVMVPWLSYGYAGKVCMCSRRAPVTPMPQAQIDEALVLAMEADKRELERLRKIESAARNLIAQRGRHNTEIAYVRLAEALKGK